MEGCKIQEDYWSERYPHKMSSDINRSFKESDGCIEYYYGDMSGDLKYKELVRNGCSQGYDESISEIEHNSFVCECL